MTETEIQKQIIDFLKALSFIVFRMNAGKGRHNQYLAPKGTPDLLVIGRGRTLWIEVKTATGTVSADQKIMHDKLAAEGQTVIIARSVEDVKYAIDKSEDLGNTK